MLGFFTYNSIAHLIDNSVNIILKIFTYLFNRDNEERENNQSGEAGGREKQAPHRARSPMWSSIPEHWYL